MVIAQQAQSDGLREQSAPHDRKFAPPSVESFRADRERADDARVLDALSALVASDGTVVDVGAGAGKIRHSARPPRGTCHCRGAE